MSISELKDRIPDFARDIRLNVETVLSPDGAPGLTDRQIRGAALACAYALDSRQWVAALQSEGADENMIEAAKSAAAIMAMNNVYYRSMHLMDDPEMKRLPARLRMNVIGRPPVDKVEFEIMSLAISALAGCGQCLSSHAQELRKSIPVEGVQSVIRIASVMNAADRALRIDGKAD